MSALCIWGKYKPAKRKSGFIPLPGATETYDSAAPYEHFDLVPPQGENMSLEDFLSAYSELFEPFVDLIRSHKVKANEDSCCHACTEASCSMRENLQNYNEITLSVSSVW